MLVPIYAFLSIISSIYLHIFQQVSLGFMKGRSLWLLTFFDYIIYNLCNYITHILSSEIEVGTKVNLVLQGGILHARRTQSTLSRNTCFSKKDNSIACLSFHPFGREYLLPLK